MTAHPLSMPASRSGALRRRRRALLLGCAAGAAALLLVQPHKARAQAFNGTFNGANANRTSIGTGTETITIGVNGGTTAIVNWSDSSTNFLPEGNVAIFEGPDGFAVLNRILGPAGANIRAEFRGRVQGRLTDGGGRGGTIIFSSPGGILVGSTASFDVGNLVLTTLTVGVADESGYGDAFDPSALNLTLGTGDPAAAIVTQAGAEFNSSLAAGSSSFVAMVAPRIVHGGTINVDGSAAFVAAEAATMTINNGLFDIVIGSGTTDGNGIVHTGTTGGPASTGAGDAHRIYMVAVPKNQAMTALLSGNIGYQPATDVTVSNGEIILSAGYGTVGGDFVQTAFPSTGAASFLISAAASDTNITSSLRGYAVADAFAAASGTGTLRFARDVSLFGGQRARLTAGPGDIDVGGNAFLSAARSASQDAASTDVFGGEVLAIATAGGAIRVGGNLSLDASGTGEAGYGNAGSGAGGTGGLVADGGVIQVGGDATVDASGFGGQTSYSEADAGAGTGGRAYVEAGAGGAISITGNLALTASGEGGATEGGSGAAGNGDGGTVSVAVLGGSSLSVGGDFSAIARGSGGESRYGSGASGDGSGGNVALAADSGGSVVITGDAAFDASGYGGEKYADFFSSDTIAGGVGSGGSVRIDVTNAASLGIGAFTGINANGFGGDGSAGSVPGAGGDGIGGSVVVTLSGEASADFEDLRIRASGLGGEGGNSGYSSGGEGSGPAGGGQGLGGDVVIDVQGGSSFAAALFGSTESAGIEVTGAGGAGGRGSSSFYEGGTVGGAGGYGQGGSVSLTSGSGGSIVVTGAEGIVIDASGNGGYGGDGGGASSYGGGVPGEGGPGGHGTGGQVRIAASGGGLSFAATRINVNGYGGPAGAVGEIYSGSSFAASIPSGDLALLAANASGDGSGIGGGITISVTDEGGQSGSASLGQTSLSASGISGGGPTPTDTAGRVVIEDLGTVESGLRFASLSVEATGSPAVGGPALAFNSDSGPVIVDADVSLNTTGDMVFAATGSGGLRAGGAIVAATDGSIGLVHTSPTADAATVAGRSVTFNAAVAINGTPQSRISATGGDATLTAPLVDIGEVQADANVFVVADSIAIVSAESGADIDLDSSGDIDILSAAAGDDFLANAGGSFTGGTVTANVGSEIIIASVGDLRLDNGEATALIDLTSSAGSILSDGTLEAPQINLDAALDLALGNIVTVDDLFLVTTNGDISGGSFSSDGAITLNSAGDIVLASADAGSFFGAFGDLVDLGDVSAAGTLSVSGSDVSIDSGTAGGFASLYSTGDLVAGTVTAAQSLYATAGGDLALGGGGSTGGSVLIEAVGEASLGTLTAGVDIIVDASSIAMVDGRAGRDVTLTAGGAIDIGFAQAGDDFRATAGDGFTADTVITTGLGEDADAESGYGPSTLAADGSNIVVTAADDLRLDNGDAATAILLNSASGDVLSDGALVAGTDLDIVAALGIDMNDADVTGFITLEAANGSLDADDLVAGGSIVAVTAGNATIVSADSGGSIDLDVAGAADLGTLTAVFDIIVDPVSIDIDSATAGGDIFLEASGDINVGFAQAGDDFVANAGGAFAGGTIIATGEGTDSEAGYGASATSGAGNIVVDAGSDLRVDTGEAFARIQLVSSGGSVLGDNSLAAGTDLSVNGSQGIDISDASAGGAISLTAGGGLDAGNLVADGAILASAEGGATIAGAESGASIAVDAGGAANLGIFEAEVDIDVDAGSILLAEGRAGRNIALDASSAGIEVGLVDAGAAFAARAAGDFSASSGSSITADTVTVEAGGNGRFNTVSAETVQLTLGGNALFTGAVSGTTIRVASADIELAEGSALGNSATELVALLVLGNGTDVTLGGDSQGPGYTLTNAEAGRISGSTFRVNAQIGPSGGGETDVFVRDLTLSGERIGRFELLASGLVEIAGALALNGVRSDGGIALTAGERIQVITPTGSIRVLGANGLPAGSLELASNNIWVGSRSLIDRLAADPNFVGRNDALLATDGIVAERGFIEAGNVALRARDSIFVQNSGTRLAFAGITVSDSLSITPTGSSPLVVYAFGRRINPDGSYVTNDDFFAEIDFVRPQGSGGFTDDSEFNRCIINTGECPARIPEGSLPEGSDIIEEPLEGEFTLLVPPATTTDLVDTSFAREPLIEEPVTSGADSILWECDVDGDGDCDGGDRNE